MTKETKERKLREIGERHSWSKEETLEEIRRLSNKLQIEEAELIEILLQVDPKNIR